MYNSNGRLLLVAASRWFSSGDWLVLTSRSEQVSCVTQRRDAAIGMSGCIHPTGFESAIARLVLCLLVWLIGCGVEGWKVPEGVVI
jgi:hypothetical protein